jgi:TorA maturation chaperone TorD
MNKVVDSEIYLEMMAAFSFFNKVLLDAPDKEYMQSVKGNLELFEEWPFSDDDSVKGLKILIEYMKKYDDEAFPALLDNFNKLFIGPGHLFAPPWESVYKEQDKTIFGAATLEVRKRYKKFGIEINNLNKEPDDHIAYECAYLNYLCAGAASAEDSEDIKAEIIDFTKEHPMTWVDEFTDLMLANSLTDFYKGIAYMLRGSFKETVRLLQK